jgi:8-oxo-dGTP pyrophosphatase MutT (NUDIX family)
LYVTHKGVHSAQVAFPGGKYEETEDLAFTALRETQEEVELTQQMPFQSSLYAVMYIPICAILLVHPYLGFVKKN